MLMKLFNRLFIFVSCMTLITVSCQEEHIPVDFLLDTNGIQIGADGGITRVKINSEGPWIANPTVPWITVSPTNGIGTIECDVKVDSSILAVESREGLVRFESKTYEKCDLKVTQEGYPNVIALSVDEVQVPNYAEYGSRYVNINVTYNVPFKMEIDNSSAWVSVPDLEEVIKNSLDRGARPRKLNLRVQFENNNRPAEREALVKFVPTMDVTLAENKNLKVVQAEADEIPDSREGDSLAIVGCARSMNISLAKYDGEAMDNWDFVTLWEENDEGYTEDKKGRVKSLSLTFFDTKDGIPYEIQFLTKMESLSLFSNTNSFLYDFTSGEYIAKLTQLKSFECFAMGLSSLDDSFTNLRNLETLVLAANNFNEIPRIITPENFPNLTKLDLATNRRRTIWDMKTATLDRALWGGFSYNDEDNFPRWLLEWDKLEYLRLSNNYMQGEIPDMEDYGIRYTAEEVAVNDTLPNGLNNPAGYNLAGKPKVLPNAKFFAINLNLYTGKIPEWILYHPHLMEWAPEILVFNQDTELTDMEGRIPGFSNVPENPDYYYEAYPLKKPEYYDQY